MFKEQLTNEALAKLENLRVQFSNFQEGCTELLKSIQNDEFIDNEISANMRDTLDNISTVQNQLSIIYKDLTLGTLPKKITEVATNVNNLHLELSLMADFIDAANFLKSLHCKENNIEEILDAQRKELNNIDIEALSLEDMQVQLQKYVELKHFYEGDGSLLPIVSAEFDYRLIFCIVQNKESFYNEFLNEAMGTVPNNVELITDKPEKQEHITEPSSTKNDEFISDTTIANEESEAKAETICVACENKVEACKIPNLAIDHENFPSVSIEPKITRAIEKERKVITASIADREIKKFQENGCSRNALMELRTNSLVDSKWILAVHGSLKKKTAEYSLQNYAYSLETYNNYGYAIKYDCGKYGVFYSLTTRGLDACKYMINRGGATSKRLINKLAERMQRVNQLLENKGYALAVLRMQLSEIVSGLSIKNSVFIQNETIDKNGRFWFSEVGADIDADEISIFTIAIDLSNPEEVHSLCTALLEDKDKWKSARAVIFITFYESSVKVIIPLLEKYMDNDFIAKSKYYYALDKKKVCSYADEHVISNFAEIIETSQKHNLEENQTEDILTNEKTVNVNALEKVVEESESVKKDEKNQETEVEKNLVSPTGADNISVCLANSPSCENAQAKFIATEQLDDVKELADCDAEKKENENEILPDNIIVNSLKQQEKEEYLDTYKKILMTGKIYSASAYLKRLMDLDTSFKNEYMQLAYAVNDPMAVCTYTSGQVVNTYFLDSDTYNSYYMVSAMLRNFYYNQCLYDYDIDSLMDYVAEDKLLANNNKLKHLVDALRMFKKDHHCGMGKYADYKKSDIAELKGKLSVISEKAREQKKLASKQSYKVAISNARFGKTLEYFFRENSDISSFLDMITVPEVDEATIELMKQYLSENFIKENAPISVENINSYKIDELIDYAWNIAGNQIRNKKATSKLVSGPRANLHHRLEEIALIICEYVSVVEQINNADLDDKDFPAYQKTYKGISSLFQSIIAECESDLRKADKDSGYKQVLLQTLKEIYSKMSGENCGFVGKYFYLPFLGDDNVLLDENYQPKFRDIKELPAMSTLACIEKHAFTDSLGAVDLQVRLDGLEKNNPDIIQSIISDDNYGSLSLLIGYLNDKRTGFKDEFIENNNMKVALEYAKNQAKKEFDDFSDDLELYQSYGQIDNTDENKKEIILQTAGLLFEAAEEEENYGFFKKVLVEFRKKIQQDAVVQGNNLKRNLDRFLSDHQEFKENEAASKLVTRIRQYINNKKYSSAEELLNRLENNDFENLQEWEMKDYLQDFLNHYDNYIKSIADNNKTLRIQVKPYKPANKDTRAAERLINAWPKGNADANDLKVKELLNSLGFNIACVDKLNAVNGKFISFAVKLQKAEGGRINNYNHPVPAFGSLGETDGFRVVYIFGAYDAEILVEIFNNIGDEMHTLVILDYALKEIVRRKLALLVKGKANGKIFAVLDRVVMKYLYDNYSEQTVNKQLLHVIMPYAYYQPYVAESSKAMPSELFIGRKEELKKIKDANGVNIVYGGRQLGKSALLMKAKKDIDNNESGDRAVYIDIKGLNYADTALKISEELVIADILTDKDITDDWRKLAMSIRIRLMNKEKPIHYFLLLLDEADAFLDSCKSVQYKPFDALKDIQASGAGRFKFVVAGLRDVVRFDHQIALNDNSVLPQLSSLTVKPFKYAEAKELLEYPLSYLGFRFRDDVETDTLVSAILSHTNSFPGMIQLYCTKLIEAMKNGYAGYKEAYTPPYYVSEEHIKKVLGEQNLQNEIRQKFFITLKVGSDNYYLLIAMITAYLYNTENEGISVTPKDVLDFAEGFGINDIAALNLEKVTALMEEMRELNVLQHNGEYGYRFTHFSFFQMMGTKASLDKELSKYIGGCDD